MPKDYIDIEVLVEVIGQNLDAAKSGMLYDCDDCNDTGWISHTHGWGDPVYCHCHRGRKK